jgi:nucleoside 2-deoxyribosyltransferase
MKWRQGLKGLGHSAEALRVTPLPELLATLRYVFAAADDSLAHGMRVYLAGPMTGKCQYNFPAFESYRNFLRGLGAEVVCPAEMDLEYGFDPSLPMEEQGFDYDEVMRRDLAALATCEGVVFLPGSEDSRGCISEGELAVALGLRVFAALQMDEQDRPRFVEMSPEWKTDWADDLVENHDATADRVGPFLHRGIAEGGFPALRAV